MSSPRLFPAVLLILAAGVAPLLGAEPLPPNRYRVTLVGGERFVGEVVTHQVTLLHEVRPELPVPLADVFSITPHRAAGMATIGMKADRDHPARLRQKELIFRVEGKQVRVPLERLAEIIWVFPHLEDHDRLAKHNGFLRPGPDGAVVVASVTRGQDMGLLRPHTRVERLTLDGDPSDEQLAGLPQMSRLRQLNVSLTAATDRGIAALLRRCPNLERLQLQAPNLTDAGLRPLADLKRLRWLYVIEGQLTDAALVTVAGAERLEWLKFEAVPLTDKELPRLEKLRRLRYLGLQGTRVTEAGDRLIRELLPADAVYSRWR
jgi:hypothetical protein